MAAKYNATQAMARNAHLQAFQQASADVLWVSNEMTWPLYWAGAREQVLALTSCMAGAIAARLHSVPSSDLSHCVQAGN